MENEMQTKKIPPKPAKKPSSSSTDRVLGLLDLFTVEKPIWTVDAIAKCRDVARVTVYRYVKALVDTGFLAPVGGEAGYALGPRFVEIDRQIRVSDPLIRVGAPVIAGLMDKGVDTQILCKFYGTQVLSIYEHQTNPLVHSSFERGRPFPLFRGAPSKCILAHLSGQQLQRLFLYHTNEISAAGLGHDWIEFRENMKAIRKIGYAVASDIDPMLLGVSAPIFSAPAVVTACICLVRRKEETTDQYIEYLGKLAIEAGRSISASLQELNKARQATSMKDHKQIEFANSPKSPARQK
jgi:DNA-binding IclR family transcriptional regulator